MTFLETIKNNIIGFKDVLTNRLNKHHDLYSTPVVAEFWEETLHIALKNIGLISNWKPNRSHQKGQDMELKNINNSRISCKSGSICNNTILSTICVTFNGSRSATYRKFEDKLNFFCDEKDDYYFLLSKKKEFDGVYTILIFPSSLCKIDQLEWTEVISKRGNKQGSISGWKGEGKFLAGITKSMSGQLWTTLPINLIEFPSIEIICPKAVEKYEYYKNEQQLKKAEKAKAKAEEKAKKREELDTYIMVKESEIGKDIPKSSRKTKTAVDKYVSRYT